MEQWVLVKLQLVGYLTKKLNKSVFLDGDWWWDINPFIENFGVRPASKSQVILFIFY